MSLSQVRDSTKVYVPIKVLPLKLAKSLQSFKKSRAAGGLGGTTIACVGACPCSCPSVGVVAYKYLQNQRRIGMLLGRLVGLPYEQEREYGDFRIRESQRKVVNDLRGYSFIFKITFYF